MPESKAGLPVTAFATGAEWEAWLDREGQQSVGIWLKLAKTASGIPSVSRQEAVDGALCYGWIDGQLEAWDAEHWLIRFTPRRARSKWSAVNRQRATDLIGLGRMKPPGLQEIERAKLDGRWRSAYAPQSTASVPDDLRAALDANEAARSRFEDLDGRNRYAILYRVQDAKKPETRIHRIAKYVAMLEQGESLYPQSEKASPRRPAAKRDL